MRIPESNRGSNKATPAPSKQYVGVGCLFSSSSEEVSEKRVITGQHVDRRRRLNRRTRVP